MNRRTSYLAIAIAAAFSLLCLTAFAKQAKAGGNASGTLHVVAIDLASGTVTVADAAGQYVATYALTAMTAVTINGQPAKLSDLRHGMHVFLLVSPSGRNADKIDATSSSPPSPGPTTATKPAPATPAPPTPAVDLISSNAFWNLLNDDQRRVVQSTGQKFRKLLDSRTFDDKSATRRATLERHALDALNGPQTTEYPAISRLGALRSTNAVPRLRELAFSRGEGDNRARWLAVRALGMIGDKSVVPDMIHLLYHRNLDTRWWAQISLVDLTGQNFGKDWNKWGKWWNAQNGQPPFNPQIIRWWSGQPEPDKLAQSIDESDRRHFQDLSNQPPE